MTRSRIILRYTILLAGLNLCGLGTHFSLLAGLGTNPWTVFHAGLANHLPLTIGQVSQLIGLIIIILSYPLGVRARIGTFLNMLFFGLFYDFWAKLDLFPEPTSLPLQYLYLILGVVVLGAGLGIYVSVGLGAGPRDGLTIGLHHRLGLSIRFVRSSVELAALLCGYLIGGPVGIGTLIFALAIGPTWQYSLKVCSRYISPLFLPQQKEISPTLGSID